jgi:hypothetical protein
LGGFFEVAFAISGKTPPIRPDPARVFVMAHPNQGGGCC